MLLIKLVYSHFNLLHGVILIVVHGRVFLLVRSRRQRYTMTRAFQ